MSDLNQNHDEGIDPFERHGRLSQTRQFLKFNHKEGIYQAGVDNATVEIGTRLIADMDSLNVGWVRWQDGSPVRREMGFVIDGFIPPPRRDLGDLDQSRWELSNFGSFGERKDPWQETEEITLFDQDTGEAFLYSASTRTGLKALRRLSRDYAAERKGKKHVGESPIIELAVEEWESKKHGPQVSPTFPIVGWVAKDPAFSAPRTASTAGAVESGTTNGGNSGFSQPLGMGDDMNNEVPF